MSTESQEERLRRAASFNDEAEHYDRAHITQIGAPLPADDLSRNATFVSSSDEAGLRHVSIVGDTYTLLLDGSQTNGHYCLIEMFVPKNGGPPPHRHDFEETFVVLEGAIEAIFRGEKQTIAAGGTLHIPANAPHSFTNKEDAPARLLCTCSPSGQEDLFLELGKLVPTPTSPPPPMTNEEGEAMQAKAKYLSPKYRTELLSPPASE